MNLDNILSTLDAEGNRRSLPPRGFLSGIGPIDFTSNDYLGLASNLDFRNSFLEKLIDSQLQFTSSASRLLAASQETYYELEDLLKGLYGREVLLFNSGYHANTGVISSLATKGSTLILADKLVHASIIDGIILSRAEFKRYRHNDINQLEQLIKSNIYCFDDILVVTESVFSMDGDKAPLDDYAQLKRLYPFITLYLDEAHAFGVEGEKGLGVAVATSTLPCWDVVVGTFGKAAASAGAFVAVNSTMKEYLVNKSRSLIFSTALPPIQAKWTTCVVKQLTNMDAERAHLKTLGVALNNAIAQATGCGSEACGHIQPFIVGDAKRAVDLSRRLMNDGIKVLPIRTPTVPRGTERLRFSLSASHSLSDIDKLQEVLARSWNGNI